jgi:cysteine desulfurase
MNTMKRIYLDNSATTSVDKLVEKVMRLYFRKEFGNPSALYKEGVVARHAVERARRDVAESLGAHLDEIVFTGSGTESDNLAVIGIVKACKGPTFTKPHIVTSVIEHPAILEACRALERGGEADVTYVGVNEHGIVNPKEIKEALRGETVLVSIMYANNEIGTVQPVKEIAKVVRAFRKTKLIQKGRPFLNSKRAALFENLPYFHTDACQATNYLNMNVPTLGVDLLTINGSKIYGPKGVGALYIKRGIKIEPIVHGGGQESGLRAGTENVPAIVGFAEAVKIASALKEKESTRLTELRDYFIKGILESVPGSILNGDERKRLPNNINISIPRIDSEQLVIELDAKGVAASARSACKSRDFESSYVIMALGRKPLQNEGGVRFSLGRDTKKKDVDYVLKILPKIIKKIQL